MLTLLQIRNLAVIDQLNLELPSGLIVLTGETGAGKSILADALSLALGDRADAGMVRTGAKEAEVIAEFSLPDHHPAEALLIEWDLADEGALLLRRVVSANGRSRAYINGRAAPMQQLKAIGETLADIHGQHAHQGLLREDVQRTLLDGFSSLEEPLHGARTAYGAYRAAKTALDALQGSEGDRDSRLELLRFQREELEAANLLPNELEQLEAESRRLGQAQELNGKVQSGVERLYEGESAIAQQLYALEQELAPLQNAEPALADVLAMITDAAIQVEEAASCLRNLGEIEEDPARLEEVDGRMRLILDLQRKHHTDFDGLLDKRTKVRQETEALENLADDIAAAERALAEAEKEYLQAAEALSKARQEGAVRLAERVETEVRKLGLGKAKFQIDVTAVQDKAFKAHGMDRIEYLVSANPGMPLRPLAKVASGGELSRISLAIQVVLAGKGGSSTLVFDEVDVGVGGAVAEVVGRLLRVLGARRQVLCVTHQPQVAAQGHHHLRVQKRQQADSTESEVVWLDTAAREEELARMLGGVEITENTRRHAREMLATASVE